MQPLVSIIVPIYNVEKYFRQCVESIIHQTYQNLEIILVDDGSPDRCGSICDEYAMIDNRITVIHKENAGVSAARNDGIEKAAGEWLMFVDPDDWLSLDCCSAVIEAVKKTNADILYFQRDENREDGRLKKEFPKIGSKVLNEEDLKKLQLDQLADYVQAFGFESTSPWGKIYRRKMVIDNDCRFPIGVKRRQDIVFNLYCLQYTKHALFYDHVGYHYRRHGGSVCRRFNKDMLDILLDYFHRVEEFVMKFHKGDETYERMLGVQAIQIHKDLRGTLFFNVAGFMPFKKYLRFMEIYYSDPSVKKYLNKPNINDFRTFKDKLSYILISNHLVHIYYCVWAFLKKLKIAYSSVF